MLTYEYICEDQDCLHEWEVEAEINDPKQTTCPKCGKETAKRLISGGSGKGIVELSGNELMDKVAADTRKLRDQAYTNENVFANLVGEGKYQSNKTDYDKQKSIRRSK